MRRVVVTGMGAITPIGNDVETFWNRLKEKKLGFGPITYFDTTDYKAKLAAEVKDFEPKDYMDPKGLRDQILAVEDFGKQLQYDSIVVPTLIVQGTEDIMTPFEQGDAVRRSIKGAELAPIPGAGHNIDQRLYADAVKGFMAGHRV